MIPTEEVEQANFVQWLQARGYKYTSIPNSTFTKSWKQKQKNARMGLRAGFPDMVIIANNKFMCVEMKRTKGGSLSTFQKDWIAALELAGVPVAVCKGTNEAIEFVKQIAGS